MKRRRKYITSATLDIPLRVVSEANQREHWRVKYLRKVEQQLEVAVEWTSRYGQAWIQLPCRVTLTRIGSRAMDKDNLAGSFKHVQDQVARMLRVDDGGDLVAWEYRQEAIGVHKYRVVIDVQSL